MDLFQCDLYDANYVGYTARHLHQRIHVGEHRYSAIGKHLETQHGNNRRKIDHLFKVLRKCKSKFDCVVYEMLYMYIKDIKPSLITRKPTPFAPNYLHVRDTFIHFYYYRYFSFCVSYTHRTRKHFMYFFKYYIFTSHFIFFHFLTW